MRNGRSPAPQPLREPCLDSARGRVSRGLDVALGGGVACVVAAAASIGVAILARHAAGYFFLFDDFALVHEASRSSAASLAATQVLGFYRPLALLLAQLEFRVFGWEHPSGYAALSAFWHCCNALLAGGIARRLGATRAGACTAAVVFLLSPWSAEAYFWTSARFDLLSALGVLASAYCALSLDDANGTARRAAWLLLGCAAALTATFAKESGVMLPALLLVLVGLSRPRALRRPWFPACLLAALGSVGLYLGIRQAILPDLGGAYGTASALFGRAHVLANLASYIRAFVTFPSYNVGLGHWPPPVVAVLIVIGLVAVISSAVSARWRSVTAMVALFFVSLTPVVAFAMLPGSSASGRLLYLPAAWIAVLVGLGAPPASARTRLASPMVAWHARAAQLGVVVVLALAVTSVLYQSRSWRVATDLSRSAIRQFAGVLDRDIGAVYIPNLPFWFAEGPYALKTYAFGYYYGDHYAVPAVTAREMVVTAHRGKPEFAGWVDRSVASAADTAGGRALELELTMPNASFPVVAPVGQLGGPH